ncbi:MAG: hypothetical protein PHI49_13215 [Halothiobacillaceae bacterium]|nr:hypothetical protein [Halothiobacillaceae bacterium]
MLRLLIQLLIGGLVVLGAWRLLFGKPGKTKERVEIERLAREKAALEQVLAEKNAEATRKAEEQQMTEAHAPARPPRSRHGFWVWLYSNGNLLGSSLALAGLGLYFSGLIDAWWWLIIPGLYLAGFLIAPAPPRPTPALQMQMDLHDALDALQHRARKGLTAERAESFNRLIESLREALPLLEAPAVGDRTAYTLRQTILDYLPATLDNYLRLPVAYRRMHKLADGRTPRQVFAAQLNTLNEEVQSSLAALADNDMQKLLAHERFLADRFSRPDAF